MTPTNELRFVDREVPMPEYRNVVAKTVRILQQKWITECKGNIDLYEWRDVPVEKETP